MSGKRYKDFDELSGDELLAQVQARRADKPEPKFETAEHRQRRADVLRENGFADEADELEDQDEPVSVEDQTPAEHLARIQRGQW